MPLFFLGVLCVLGVLAFPDVGRRLNQMTLMYPCPSHRWSLNGWAGCTMFAVTTSSTRQRQDAKCAKKERKTKMPVFFLGVLCVLGVLAFPDV